MIKNRYIFSTLILSSAVAVAADLNPSAGPADTLSYTLQDICNRLGSGEEGTQRNFTEPTSGPADSTDCTLNKVMEKAPAVTEEAAEPDDVTTGKKYWELTHGNWGIRTGTRTETGTDGNVKCLTDRDRFKDYGKGTVIDTCTNLNWLKSPNCFKGKKTWDEAEKLASSLYDGWTGDGNGGDCGLSDGSGNNWRLPSVYEFLSLMDFIVRNDNVSLGHLFELTSGEYWSTNTDANNTSYRWGMDLDNGRVYTYDKTGTYSVWPVRGRH